MKIKNTILTIFAIALTLNAWTLLPREQETVYSPDWESLSKHNREPEWFKDAKFGIYFHWGVYCVPAFDSEWYPRWMYFPDRGDSWGGDVYEHHLNTYGPPTEFNYHDFTPMFKAEHFNAEAWAKLFESSGAKFAGPVAQHHDGFAMWDSEVNPWNVKDKGPEKDIMGDLFTELRKRDMKTIATFHHARLLQRYAEDSANWAGKGPDVAWNSHYPYHPDYATSSTDPELRLLYGNIPEDEFHDYWLNQVKEVVNEYSPDIIWFDSWLDLIPESYRQEMVAHQFNAGVRDGRESVVAYKQEDLPSNVGMLDIEQGGKTDLSEDYWLTDITLSHGSWCYTQGQTYKEPALVIRNMIDVWSKKGVALLNISPKADGTIPGEQQKVLIAIGEWLNKHQEAVYNTRAHTVYGYGIAEFEAGHFGGQSATMEYTKDDIRFTISKDEKTLYIFSLGMPESDSELKLKHILDTNNPKTITEISVVGSDAELEWNVEADQLVITIPAASEMDETATVFRVEFR